MPSRSQRSIPRWRRVVRCMWMSFRAQSPHASRQPCTESRKRGAQLMQPCMRSMRCFTHAACSSGAHRHPSRSCAPRRLPRAARMRHCCVLALGLGAQRSCQMMGRHRSWATSMRRRISWARAPRSSPLLSRPRIQCHLHLSWQPPVRIWSHTCPTRQRPYLQGPCLWHSLRQLFLRRRRRPCHPRLPRHPASRLRFRLALREKRRLRVNRHRRRGQQPAWERRMMTGRASPTWSSWTSGPMRAMHQPAEDDDTRCEGTCVFSRWSSRGEPCVLWEKAGAKSKQNEMV